MKSVDQVAVNILYQKLINVLDCTAISVNAIIEYLIG